MCISFRKQAELLTFRSKFIYVLNFKLNTKSIWEKLGTFIKLHKLFPLLISLFFLNICKSKDRNLRKKRARVREGKVR